MLRGLPVRFRVREIRQVLGHRRLPEFVGNIDEEAPYRPA
jgi:hypothetical protein